MDCNCHAKYPTYRSYFTTIPQWVPRQCASKSIQSYPTERKSGLLNTPTVENTPYGCFGRESTLLFPFIRSIRSRWSNFISISSRRRFLTTALIYTALFTFITLISFTLGIILAYKMGRMYGVIFIGCSVCCFQVV